MKAELVLLAPEAVAARWHYLAKPIDDALAHGCGESTSLDYLRKVLNKQAQVWAVINDSHIAGVGVTQFLQYTNHKTLHVVAYAGEGWIQWAELFSQIEDFARKGGAIAIEQWGRPGWSKILPKVIPGFEVAYHVLRKKL